MVQSLWYSYSITREVLEMKERFISIVGFEHYVGQDVFPIGSLVLLKKQPDNKIDGDAIRAVFPNIGTIGYVANGYRTVAGGTLSASRIYDSVADTLFVRVLFTTNSKVICKIESDGSNDKLLSEEYAAQLLEVLKAEAPTKKTIHSLTELVDNDDTIQF